jgi:hypothetical protein
LVLQEVAELHDNVAQSLIVAAQAEIRPPAIKIRVMRDRPEDGVSPFDLIIFNWRIPRLRHIDCATAGRTMRPWRLPRS